MFAETTSLKLLWVNWNGFAIPQLIYNNDLGSIKPSDIIAEYNIPEAEHSLELISLMSRYPAP